MSYVLPDHIFVAAYCRDEVSSSPEVLPYKVSFPFRIRPRNVDRALPFDVSDYELLSNLVFNKLIQAAT